MSQDTPDYSPVDYDQVTKELMDSVTNSNLKASEKVVVLCALQDLARAMKQLPESTKDRHGSNLMFSFQLLRQYYKAEAL